MVNNQQAPTEAGTVTAGQAARLLMLSPRRLRQLAADGHIPSAVRGRYPLAAVITGYLRFLKASIERSADNPGAGLASAKEKEIRLRLAQREATLIDASDAEAFHSFSARLYRDELAGLGKSVSRDPIIACQIDAALTAALDRFDKRFAEALPKFKRGDDPLA
jgi:hypothetical protein